MSDEHDTWLQTLGVPAGSFSTPQSKGGDEDEGSQGSPPPTQDPAQDEHDRRQQQQEQAGQPVTDRMAGAATDLLVHYISENLRPLREEALRDLARAWRESPGGVIAAGAVLGSAGVAYLVGTGNSVPKLPAIPLDFLAGRAPIFRGAELNIQVSGPITRPESIQVSITFHEQSASPQQQPRRGSGRGRALTPRLTLARNGVSAASPETGSNLEIEGRVSIPSDASADDVSATRAAIQDGRVEIDVGGSPVGMVRVLSVADNFRPDPYGLAPPPTIRYLNVRLRTTIPPIFHQGPDQITELSVSVRINGVSSDGEARTRVHIHQAPAPSTP